jgi:hypothetical protein
MSALRSMSASSLSICRVLLFAISAFLCFFFFLDCCEVPKSQISTHLAKIWPSFQYGLYFCSELSSQYYCEPRPYMYSFYFVTTDCHTESLPLSPSSTTHKITPTGSTHPLYLYLSRPAHRSSRISWGTSLACLRAWLLSAASRVTLQFFEGISPLWP